MMMMMIMIILMLMIILMTFNHDINHARFTDTDNGHYYDDEQSITMNLMMWYSQVAPVREIKHGKCKKKINWRNLFVILIWCKWNAEETDRDAKNLRFMDTRFIQSSKIWYRQDFSETFAFFPDHTQK